MDKTGLMTWLEGAVKHMIENAEKITAISITTIELDERGDEQYDTSYLACSAMDKIKIAWILNQDAMIDTLQKLREDDDDANDDDP